MPPSFTIDNQRGWGSIRKKHFEDLERLESLAGIHSKRGAYYRILSEKFPFIICYDLRDAWIEVVAVLSCRMNPERIDAELSQRRSIRMNGWIPWGLQRCVVRTSQ